MGGGGDRDGQGSLYTPWQVRNNEITNDADNGIAI